MKLTGAKEKYFDRLCEFSDGYLNKLRKVIKAL
jgi:hypothetical protein